MSTATTNLITALGRANGHDVAEQFFGNDMAPELCEELAADVLAGRHVAMDMIDDDSSLTEDGVVEALDYYSSVPEFDEALERLMNRNARRAARHRRQRRERVRGRVQRRL